VQARTAQHLGDLGLAQRWAQGFETLHRVPHEVGELVDGLADLDERVRSFFIDAFCPGSNRGG
jgi:hypothetical protein